MFCALLGDRPPLPFGTTSLPYATRFQVRTQRPASSAVQLSGSIHPLDTHQ